MERHNDVRHALWSYGAIEVAQLEQTAHFAPAPASETRVIVILADGGVVGISTGTHNAVIGSAYRAGARAINPDAPPASGCGDSYSSAHDDVIKQTRDGYSPFRLPIHQNHRIELGSGAGWMWDGHASLMITPHPPGRALLALLPVATVTARLGSITGLTGRVLSATQGGGAICAHMLAAFATQAPLLNGEQRLALGDGALDAIIVWLRSEQKMIGHLSTHRRELLTAISAYIERCLDDDQLSPHAIADRFGISVRYLHMLFASTGITVARWITIRRLEVIRSELLRRGGDRGSIRDVATRWGFHDLPHFSRVFRQHFGEPPSVYVRRRTGVRNLK